MVQQIPRLQAEELMLQMQVQRISTGAGSLSSLSKSGAKAAIEAFNRLISDLRQQVQDRSIDNLGVVTEAWRGREVLSGADQLASWFWRNGEVQL